MSLNSNIMIKRSELTVLSEEQRKSDIILSIFKTIDENKEILKEFGYDIIINEKQILISS